MSTIGPFETRRVMDPRCGPTETQSCWLGLEPLDRAWQVGRTSKLPILPRASCIRSGSCAAASSRFSTLHLSGRSDQRAASMSSNPSSDDTTHTANIDATNVQSSHTMALPRFNSRPAPPREPNNINIPKITPLSSKASAETIDVDADDKSTDDKSTAGSSNSEPKLEKKSALPKIVPTSDQSPETLAEGLEGKYVDEFGNILDWDGTVLGRVEGDLPSMVGRPVSEDGKIIDLDGETAGYVSENYSKPPLKPLAGNLKTDDAGNIYNGDGQIIGKLTPPEEKDGDKAPDSDKKSAATPSPSEVYLDVKSTHDGIQLIIKIPTVFKSG